MERGEIVHEMERNRLEFHLQDFHFFSHFYLVFLVFELVFCAFLHSQSLCEADEVFNNFVTFFYILLVRATTF